MRPLIGIVMDWVEKGSFSPRPHYAVRDSYFKAVWAAGGLPVGLPLLADALNAAVDNVQAVIVPGGDYPSPGRWYGDGHGGAEEHPRGEMNEALLRRLIAENKPFLAICAGHQELCAATGGLLWWKVKESLKGAGEHRGGGPMVLGHKVKVEPGSLLHALVGAEEIEVNSHHYEAVREVAGGLVVSGRAPDGVIEAIEVPGKTFALGVQWHPEILLTEADRLIFQGLVQAAGGSN
ncbi:MAG: gamma-glutamyl-gamma-aminobutyrate hydrolase family protein [Proteobacteria bacterium]|nr:gamma-glutamyl-gamma-aminobutyrate hydrolase family protein [Pseudomonadota bacterium]